MVNNLPTIYEVVTGVAKKQAKEKTPNSSSKSNKPTSKVVSVKAFFVIMQSEILLITLSACSSRESSPALVQRLRCQPPRMKKTVVMRTEMKWKRSMTTLYVELVEPMMARTSFGSAVTTVRSGITGSASRSRPHVRSISSTTGALSAPTATATRGSSHERQSIGIGGSCYKESHLRSGVKVFRYYHHGLVF